jgi:phosphatidylserine decarboxylase
MTLRSHIWRVVAQDDINFLVTNRIPRRLVTQFVGWFSKIEQPLVRDLSIGVWRFFSDVDLSEARKSDFRSMHDCFIRELKEGERPVDHGAKILVSPCDAIIGACGAVDGTTLYQIKGFPYTLDDLMGATDMVDAHRDSRYVTLRLTSGMYHRFHAPHDCRVEQVTYISGDTWNVNPAALRRVERLFCKNERVLVKTRLGATSQTVTLVAVGAILVGSIRLHFVDVLFNLAHRGPNVITCDAQFAKGEEMGWFEHGSTIIIFAQREFALCDNVKEGAIIRMGEPLMRLPE